MFKRVLIYMNEFRQLGFASAPCLLHTEKNWALKPFNVPTQLSSNLSEEICRNGGRMGLMEKQCGEREREREWGKAG